LAPTLYTPPPANHDPDTPPPQQVITFNQTAHDLYLEATKYCWITKIDLDHDFSIDDYPPACQALYATYCDYNDTAPSPTPLTRVPAVCTPDRAAYYTYVPPVATPSPVQAGMTGACDTFYKVVAGDSCLAVATKYGIILADFYAWNPAVGERCAALQVGVWVCVGADERLLGKRGNGPVPTPPPVNLGL